MISLQIPKLSWLATRFHLPRLSLQLRATRSIHLNSQTYLLFIQRMSIYIHQYIVKSIVICLFTMLVTCSRTPGRSPHAGTSSRSPHTGEKGSIFAQFQWLARCSTHRASSLGPTPATWCLLVPLLLPQALQVRTVLDKECGFGTLGPHL